MFSTKAIKQTLTHVWVHDLLWALAGSMFIAIAAQITLRLPFSPVPFTLQPQAVLMVAATLGSRRGFYALLAYILEGALGAPVFAGGVGGLIFLLGPTGGYLLGYLPVSLIIGRLCEFKGLLFPKLLLGNILVFCFGAPWLAYFVGPVCAWKMGVYPFIFADFLKSICAWILIPFSKNLYHKIG